MFSPEEARIPEPTAQEYNARLTETVLDACRLAISRGTQITQEDQEPLRERLQNDLQPAKLIPMCNQFIIDDVLRVTSLGNALVIEKAFIQEVFPFLRYGQPESGGVFDPTLRQVIEKEEFLRFKAHNSRVRKGILSFGDSNEGFGGFLRLKQLSDLSDQESWKTQYEEKYQVPIDEL